MTDDIDPDLLAMAPMIEEDPDQFQIELDRHLVETGGLSRFMELAWPIVEGSEDSFISNWHLDAINEYLMAVSAGEIRRLIIAIPPRHAKSLTAAVMWPAYDWIKRPWRRFLFASYAHNLSIRDGVKCRRIVESDWYQKRWGHRFQVTSDQNTKVKFENDKSGYRLSTSVGGQLTGEGGDVVCVDDAHNVRAAESELKRTGTLQWWDESLSSRLNNPKTGSFVVIGQRVHERDLSGHIMAKNSIVPWTVLCLPAEYESTHPQRWHRDPRKEEGELLWPERVGHKELDELKLSLGPYGSAGQLQQRPAPREGGIFKRRWFRPIAVAPADTQWVRGWDFAATSKSLIKSDPDYTAHAKVGYSQSLGGWVIGHIARDRMEPHQVEAWTLEVAQRDGVAVQIQMPQDPGAGGKAFAHAMLRHLSRFTVYADPVTGDKMSRALSWAGKAGAGLVSMVEGDWNKDWLDEVTSFPTGGHDDMVDAVSSAFDRLVNNTLGILTHYERSLVAMGVDPGTLRSPSQVEAEKKAVADKAAADRLAAEAGSSEIDRLAALLNGR